MTNEIKHTPGPWQTQNVPFINEKFHQKIGPAIIKNRISDDDARLIAAAPDLLEALRYVRHRIEICDEWWIDSPERGGIDTDIIDAAIAKAEGRT